MSLETTFLKNHPAFKQAGIGALVVLAVLFVFVLGFHADSHIYPRIEVAVLDMAGQPVAGAEVYFTNFAHWPKPKMMPEPQTTADKLSSISISDEKGKATIEGYFGYAIRIPTSRSSVYAKGFIQIEKKGYEKTIIDIDSSYEERILKKRFSLIVRLKPLPHGNQSENTDPLKPSTRTIFQ